MSTANGRAAGVPPVGFTPKTLAFLRALERNNRREWFHARKDRYEIDVRAPMVALVERLAVDLPAFAPDLVASTRVSIYRPYRDTRFSSNKTPLKTNVAAVVPHRLLGKHEGAGFYIEVAPHHVWYGGGMYMPTPPQLHLVREHIAAHHRRFARIVGSPVFRRTFGALEGSRLQRVPRGFPADHPAAEFLKFRQFLAACERPAEFATTPGFYRTLLEAWRRLAPLVEFLNAPLVEGLRTGSLGHAWRDE
ncbi:MAG: DUF2461 domain-containing protein [Acidobacteria bacterium]|nr:DUF2461 domain-containing protein [Acidobacteriota bacterium]